MAAPFIRPVHTRFNEADHAIRMAYAYLKGFSLEQSEEKEEHEEYQERKKAYFTQFVIPSAGQYLNDAEQALEALHAEGALPSNINAVMANIVQENDAMVSALDNIGTVLENRVPPREYMEVELEKARRSARELMKLWDTAYHYAANGQQAGSYKSKTRSYRNKKRSGSRRARMRSSYKRSYRNKKRSLRKRRYF